MLAHMIEGGESNAWSWLLRVYARHEVKLLGRLYRLLNGRTIRNRFSRELAYWTLVYPGAAWGIAGMPVSQQELENFIDSLGPSRYAVGPCRCRLAHGGCDHPTETDIVIKSGFGIWTELFPGEYREISAGEAVEICRDCQRQGLIQIAYKHMDYKNGGNFFVICNCCTDGCLPLLALRVYGSDRYPFRKGGKIALVDVEKCVGCRNCVSVCPFNARTIEGGKAVVLDCYGCGLCLSRCEGNASSMA